MDAFPMRRLIRRVFPRSLKTLIRFLCVIPWLAWLAIAPAAGIMARTEAPIPAPAAAATRSATAPLIAPDATTGQTITVPGMQVPNGLAVDRVSGRIYITSRNNGQVFMLNSSTFAVAGQTQVGNLPWGVAVDHDLNRVWVANFGSGTLSVLDATNLGTVATISMGANAQPTFVGYLPAYQRVFVANHGADTIAVVNAINNTVEKFITPGGKGAWGLAVNPNHNRVYVTFRETRTLLTLDAAQGWNLLPGSTIRPCGDYYPAAPFGLAFNKSNNKLYLACAPEGSVNTAVVYQAGASGLNEISRTGLPNGGDNSGGVAVNTISGNAFFTNSSANNVSIIGHPSNQIVGTEAAGQDPFAVAVNEFGSQVIIGNRGSNSLTVLADPYLPMAYEVNGVAVNQTNGKVFITSRENGLLLRLKGQGSTELDGAFGVGRQPWGVAVNPITDKVYVADFTDGDVRVLQASTLTPLATIPMGGEPTFVEVDSAANRAFTVSHLQNRLVVINGSLNTVEASQPTGGAGAFGLAINPALNRAYVSHRGTGDIATMDGSHGWQSIESQRINACGADRTPYALAFNVANNRLYVACATDDNVNFAVVYRAAGTGLTRLATLPLGAGGSNGGGGIAVNPTTGNVFFTNSVAGTVTTINDRNELAGAPRPVGLDPFGIAVDAVNGYVYVGLRLGNDVFVFNDTTAPSPTGPRLYLSRQDGCAGVPLTVFGAGFLASVGHSVELRMDGALLATALVDAGGAFVTPITVPGPANPGGVRTLMATDTALPAITARATLRTPRTDLPVIFMGGIAGSRLMTQREFQYEIPGWFGIGDLRTYGENGVEEEIWLGNRSISEALTGNDKHFYPLRLGATGLDPFPDPKGRIAYVYAKQPVWVLEPPFDQPVVDIYIGLYARMYNALTAQRRNLYDFGYDWRKDLNVSDPLLDRKINEVLAATGKDKVVLVGHSMGGMLARHYILKYGVSKIDQVITFGTPYLGSVNPAKYLEMGDSMGMIGDLGPFHFELDSAVVKEMAINYGGLYQMLPGRLWYNHSPFDGVSFDPRYMAQASEMRQEGLLGDIWSAVNVNPLNYDQTKAYLARNYNATLVEQGDRFTAAGVGDLTLMTDQYINQRIIGTGSPTWGHLWVCQRPCWVCTTWGCNDRYDVPAIPVLDALGDDTVPLRSAAASEPISKMLLDGHYYFVDNAHHMTLGADARVQNLVVGLLKGDFCTNQQALPPGNPGAAAAGAIGLAPDATEEDYAALGTTTGVQLTLIGAATMSITDAQGRHVANDNGLLAGYANTIPGATLVAVTNAQVAALTTGGPFTVAIHGTAAEGAARLKVENLRAGAIVRTLAFPGLPITTTTTATLTLAAATVEPGAVLTYRYTPDSPEQAVTTVALDGERAGDVTAPTVQVTLDYETSLVTITAADEEGGSGVQQVVYSRENSAAHILPYDGPFLWPAGAACVTGLAIDRTGNTGAGWLCRTWLPMGLK